jgi:hypothetical protein
MKRLGHFCEKAPQTAQPVQGTRAAAADAEVKTREAAELPSAPVTAPATDAELEDDEARIHNEARLRGEARLPNKERLNDEARLHDKARLPCEERDETRGCPAKSRFTAKSGFTARHGCTTRRGCPARPGCPTWRGCTGEMIVLSVLYYPAEAARANSAHSIAITQSSLRGHQHDGRAKAV